MLKCTVSFENPNTKDVKVKHAYLAYHCVLKSLQYWSICSSSMYDVAVLFQVGEEKLVLEIGQAALRHPDSKPYVHDVLLAMALAEVRIA